MNPGCDWGLALSTVCHTKYQFVARTDSYSGKPPRWCRSGLIAFYRTDSSVAVRVSTPYSVMVALQHLRIL